MSVAAVTTLGLAGVVVGQTSGDQLDTAGTTVLVASSTAMEEQLTAETESLSEIVSARAAAARDAVVAAEVLDLVKAQRSETTERATRDAERRELEAAAAAKAAADAAAAAAAKAEALASASPRELGQILAAERGWSGEQWSCLDSLWQRESNWSPTARNSSSGAFGIPQSLPGSKMASAGSDWQTNPATQISWGLTYIADRYGSPCGAWGHSESHNWY